MEFFENVSMRVRAIISKDNGQIVIIRQNIKDNSCWNLPGGGVNYGETLEQALIREISEETNIRIANPKLVAIRETIIRDYHRTYEYFFLVRYVAGDLHPGTDPELDAQIILDAKWINSGDIAQHDVKPCFISQIITDDSNFTYVNDTLSIAEYINTYGVLPFPNNGCELVHVFLKPDALEYNLAEILIREFECLGGVLIDQVKTKLCAHELGIIYYDFKYELARDQVFNYLTSHETLHLAFIGKSGLHDKFNKAKGRSGSGEGLRGKYVKWYTKLNNDEFEKWVRGEHEQQDKINLEMFCRDLLHVADDAAASIRGLEIVFSKH